MDNFANRVVEIDRNSGGKQAGSVHEWAVRAFGVISIVGRLPGTDDDSGEILAQLLAIAPTSLLMDGTAALNAAILKADEETNGNQEGS